MKKQSYLLVFLFYSLLYLPTHIFSQSPTNNNEEDIGVVQATSTEELIETQFTNNQVFTDYPWLEETIDKEECVVEAISTYKSGSFSFIYVHKKNGGTLYFEDGTFFCEQTANYNCITAYRLEDPIAVWTCPQQANSEDDFAASSDQTIGNASINCNTYQGKIVFEPCDDGLSLIHI